MTNKFDYTNEVVMAHDEYQETRDQIVEAAREVFAKYGYRKATIEDISSAVYKAKSSVYHYFKGKDDIFKAVVEKEASHLLHAMRDAVDREQDPVTKFRTLFKFMIMEMAEKHNYYHFLKDEWFLIFNFTIDVRKTFENLIISMFVSIFNEGNRQGIFDINDPETDAKAMQISLSGFITPWGNFGGGDIIDMVDPFLDIILNGLIKRPDVVAD